MTIVAGVLMLLVDFRKLLGCGGLWCKLRGSRSNCDRRNRKIRVRNEPDYELKDVSPWATIVI